MNNELPVILSWNTQFDIWSTWWKKFAFVTGGCMGSKVTATWRKMRVNMLGVICWVKLWSSLRMKLIWTKVTWIAVAYLLGTFGALVRWGHPFLLGMHHQIGSNCARFFTGRIKRSFSFQVPFSMASWWRNSFEPLILSVPWWFMAWIFRVVGEMNYGIWGATLSDYVAVIENVPIMKGEEKVEDILKEAGGRSATMIMVRQRSWRLSRGVCSLMISRNPCIEEMPLENLCTFAGSSSSCWQLLILIEGYWREEILNHLKLFPADS